jgi:septum site-determining protein MinD
MVRRKEMLSPDDVTDILAIKLIGIVPEDDTVVPASNSGVPVTLNHNSRAGIAFRNLARRLDGEKVPFMQLDESGSIFQRLSRLIGGTG